MSITKNLIMVTIIILLLARKKHTQKSNMQRLAFVVHQDKCYIGCVYKISGYMSMRSIGDLIAIVGQ